MINLSNWLDSRGTFKDVQFGDVELQIVSLSDSLIEQLKVLPTHESMIDFIAEHGLSHKRMRISDDKNMCEDLPLIWALPEFTESKKQIVEAVCELSDVSLFLSDKKTAEEKDAEELANLEAEENEDKSLSGDGDMPLDVDLGTIEKEYNAHNNITQ